MTAIAAPPAAFVCESSRSHGEEHRTLAIVVNGEVVVAPKIVGRTGEIAIEADFSWAEAEAIAAAFNRRAGKR